MAKLVIGCGYLGERVARLWKARGAHVHVTTRSANRAEWWRAQGYTPHVLDVTSPSTLGELPLSQTVLYAVGHDRSKETSIHQVQVDGLRWVLEALPAETGRFLYISSTGVYGQSEGEWVDETSPTQPRREGGRACLAAEQLLAVHPLGMRSLVLRLAGLYGPGRLPHREQLAQGLPLQIREEGFLNLIHVDDAARIILLAEERGTPPRTYVVSDGHPVRRGDYYAEYCRLIGAPPPCFIPPPPGDEPTRAAESKRIRIDRVMRELSPDFLYPSYREGLAAILTDERKA